MKMEKQVFYSCDIMEKFLKINTFLNHDNYLNYYKIMIDKYKDKYLLENKKVYNCDIEFLITYIEKIKNNGNILDKNICEKVFNGDDKKRIYFVKQFIKMNNYMILCSNFIYKHNIMNECCNNFN